MQLSLDQTGNDPGFRGPEVCKLAGISYRQLDYWTRTGLIRPSVAEARGSGSQRLYSYRDVVEVKVIKNLLDGGVLLQRARRAIEYLREQGGDVASANLVIDGSNSVLARTDAEMVDLVRRGQGVLNIVPLAGVTEELDAKIMELPPRAEREAGADAARAGGTDEARAASGG